ncbi:MAG TPA: hypothetical protein VFX61_09940 [Micromonosporaceae bacterium]|nr:hypothetical protein [Micromonosporaceae bacterium]
MLDDPAIGARSKNQRGEREQRRLRLIALVTVSVVLLGALPAFFGLRALSRDPVFSTLDALPVPAWAATQVEDQVSGSRWCLVDCRLRERTAQSEHGWEETAQVYEQALTTEGWRPWRSEFCPEQQVEGSYTCWQRDELTLDLWVRASCPLDPEQALPAEELNGPEAPPTDAAECGRSVVTVKVRNAIDDKRTRPQPSTDPSLIGEEPDPVLTDDPLSPTPS